jgi:hypothetical protein
VTRNQWDQTPEEKPEKEYVETTEVFTEFGGDTHDDATEEFKAFPEAEDFSWGPNEVDERLLAELRRKADGGSVTAQHQLEALERDQGE